MKVVHVVMSNDFAGIEQHVDELLSNNLVKDPILICNESIADNFDPKIQIFKIKNYGRRSFIGKYKIKKLLKKINPDIIHTHGTKTTSLICAINKKNFIHVSTVHGIKKNKKVFQKPDIVIGVSDKAIEGIKNKTKVITNWWHPDLIKHKSKGNKYALAIGRLEKVKGFDLLIQSWKNIKTNLVIVGSGKEKTDLISLINKYNLGKKIKIIDFVSKEKLKSYYKDASLLIISSRNEGGPRVALEALFLKIPVLSTDVGHMDIILPQELLAQKNDQSSLQKLLENYVDEIELVNQDAIFDFVSDEFSINSKINELNEVYRSLLTS